MYFNFSYLKMLIFLAAVKATTKFDDPDDLKEFINYSRNSQETTCQICFKVLFTNNPNNINELESNVESFVNNRTLIFCSSSPKHIFHKRCFIRWLFSKNNCPVCRKDFTDELFENLLFDVWSNFYNFDAENQNELILQLKSMNVLYLTKVFRIIKFNLGENKLEELKNFIPEDKNKKRLIKIIDAYKKEKDINDFIFASRALKSESLTDINEIFKFQELSKLNAYDLLQVCRNLDCYCLDKLSDMNKIYRVLGIYDMDEYEEKFSFSDFNKFLTEEASLYGDYQFLKYICLRMNPQEPFDEMIALENIFEHTQIKSKYSTSEYASNFISCYLNFYKLEKKEFFRRLIIFMINNKEIVSKNGKILKMKRVFEYIFMNIFECSFNILIPFLDSIVKSKENFDEHSRDVLVEFILSFFDYENEEKMKEEENKDFANEFTEEIIEGNNNIFEGEESESDDNDESMREDSDENDSNQIIEEDAENVEENVNLNELPENTSENENNESMEEQNDLTENGNTASYEFIDPNLKYDSLIEYTINSPILGGKFLEEFYRIYDSLPRDGVFIERVKYFENEKPQNALE